MDHNARRQRVGASEVAAILGHNEYMTPLDVWLVKTGRKPHFEGNEHTRRGQRQEGQILDWLSEDLEKMIFRDCVAEIHPSGLAAATPDGIVDCGTFNELAETKSTLKTIRDESEIPTSWLLQCQWQMLCTGLKKCHLAIFGPIVSNYQRFEIAYNESFAAELLAQAEEWWQVHIVGDLQPEPINEADVLQLWPIDDGTTIEAVPMLADAIMQHSELKAIAKDLEAKIKPLRDRIVLAIGHAQAVRFGGRTIASYKATVKGSRIFRTF